MPLRRLILGLSFFLPRGALVAQQGSVPASPLPARTSLGVDLGYTTFSGSTESWRLAALSLQRKEAAGTLIGRMTVVQRYGITGTQYEADAYPRLGPATYAYLNVGRSSSTLFPEWRYGAELFANLPLAYEASLGVRHLRFTDAPVTLYTGSLGRYMGNYWFSLRPFVRSLNGSLSTSAGLTARRYHESADEYIGARVGYGNTPSDRVTTNELLRQNSVSADVHGSARVATSLIGIWQVAVEHEKLDPAQTRNNVELNGGLRWDF